MKNKYYICQSYRALPIVWNPFDPVLGVAVQEVFFGAVFRAFEEATAMSGLTIYLTDDLDVLPSYGEHVVAVVTGDEWSCAPRYADRVRATFKCYGTDLEIGPNPFSKPSYLNWLAALQYVRNQVHRLPYVWYARARKNGRQNIYPIPLGYATQIDLPVKPVLGRSIDVFFAGSLSHKRHAKWSPKYWLRSPKEVSREKMVEELAAFKQQYPEFNVELFLAQGFTPHAITWGTFDASKMMSPESYSRTMMDCKVCVVPRGTSLETFRYFESIRYGCITIAEALPGRWFYTGAPSISLQSWRDLKTTLTDLLSDEKALEQRHHATLHWWNTVCSEQAVGHYMARTLEINASLVADANFRVAS